MRGSSRTDRTGSCENCLSLNYPRAGDVRPRHAALDPVSFSAGAAGPDGHTRTVITAAACCLERDGYAGVSIETIAEAAGVPERVLLDAYGTCEQLVAHVAFELAAGLVTAVGGAVEGVETTSVIAVGLPGPLIRRAGPNSGVLIGRSARYVRDAAYRRVCPAGAVVSSASPIVRRWRLGDPNNDRLTLARL